MRNILKLQNSEKYFLEDLTKVDTTENGFVLPEQEKGWLGLTLEEIVEEYGGGEPLDGDDVDRVCEIIKHKLNLFQGNIIEQEYNELIDLKHIQGDFVDDGSNYQLFDYVFSTFNSDNGYTNLEVRDFDDNLMGEIENIELPDEDDKDAVLVFEREIINWLQSENLI